MIVKSKIPLTIDARNGRKEIIALKVSSWNKELDKNRYRAIVSDMIVIKETHPMPGNTLNLYQTFNTKEVFYKNEDINALFTQIGESITPDLSYSKKQDELIARALLIITQETPIYGSSSEDWELVDETSEIAE